VQPPTTMVAGPSVSGADPAAVTRTGPSRANAMRSATRQPAVSSAVTSPGVTTVSTPASTPRVIAADVPSVSQPLTPGAVSTSAVSVGDIPNSANVAGAQARVTTLSQTPPQAAQTPITSDPLSAVASVASDLVGAALSMFGAGSAPTPPTDSPAAWSLLAFARREFHTATGAPVSADTSPTAQTTSQALVADTAAVQAPAVQNTLTYTAAPDLFDVLVVNGLRVARDIFGFFGLNFGGIVGSLLSSQDPPFFLTFGLTAQQTQYEISPGNVWKVWTFTPPNPTGKTVIGIHGGGFILEPNIMHWIDYTQMARDTGATVVVPIYPLATTPAGAIVNVQPVMADFISQQIDRYGAENVSIHADSGGVTYTLGAVRELILRGDRVPASMVLLSGQAYFSLDNPDIRLIDDPFFDVDHLEFYVDNSHAFDGITGEEDPRISPLFMETAVLQALPPTTIYVGEVEFLLPDNLLLYQRAVDIGAPISMVVGTGLPHDWALGGLRTYSQTPVVRPDIYRELGLTPSAQTATV
jgi:acetyl esterase/lipase